MKSQNSPDENGVVRETPESYWYKISGKPFPVMRNYLAVKINPTKFHDQIEPDIITMAVEANEWSSHHAWCENEDGQMLISEKVMSLESARRYCQGDD